MRRPATDLWDRWLAAPALFLLTFLSRIPFRSRILYHWDSVNFAYAMREFNVAKEQPQPPGYIVYVWLCRAVDLLFGDPQTTMVWISIVASALAVVALYYLGKAMFDARTGLIAALLLATSPLVWFYGEIALPHSLDMLLVIVGVWWLYETMLGRYGYLYPAVAVMAIAGGVRQQTLVFLAPLIVFALRKVGWKRFIAAGILGALICLAWFVPLTLLSGGVRGYLQAMGAYAGRYNATTSVFAGGGWWGLRRNLIKLTLYTLFGWSVAALPWAVYAVRRVWQRAWPSRWERVIFFALWLVPTLVFYTLIHMGQQGLTFVFLPALLLWGAKGLTAWMGEGPRRHLAVATAALLLVNVGIFVVAPEYPLPTDRVRLLTRATLAGNDRYFGDRFDYIEAHTPAASTAILTSNWHHLEYYLSEYRLLPMDVVAKWELGEGQVLSAPTQTVSAEALDRASTEDRQGQVVVFDEVLLPFNDTPELAQPIELPSGERMALLTVSAGQLVYYGQSFGVSGSE